MVSSNHIEPNGEGKIAAKVYTKGRRGRLVKRISVFTNDPENKRVILKIMVNVKSKIFLN